MSTRPPMSDPRGEGEVQGAASSRPEPSQVEPASGGAGPAASVSSAEAVCHDEQMTIWTGEIADSISMGGYLREDLSYDDKLDLHAIVARDLRSIIGNAFLQAEPTAPCDDPPSGRDLQGLGGDGPAGAVGEAEALDLLSELGDAASILHSNDAPYCASAVQRAANTIEKQAAENTHLSTALAESERKSVTLDDVRGAMWRLGYERRAGDDLWPAILKARDVRLAKADTPTQETPNAQG